MSDLAALLLLPFLAAVIFVGMHTWLGLQVLRRGVVFADLALAQLSALGATVAVAAGHAPGGPEGFGYALLFTGLGAVLLTLTRRVQAEVSQEAVIGIVYVVATAFTVMVVPVSDFSRTAVPSMEAYLSPRPSTGSKRPVDVPSRLTVMGVGSAGSPPPWLAWASSPVSPSAAPSPTSSTGRPTGGSPTTSTPGGGRPSTSPTPPSSPGRACTSSASSVRVEERLGTR